MPLHSIEVIHTCLEKLRFYGGSTHNVEPWNNVVNHEVTQCVRNPSELLPHTLTVSVDNKQADPDLGEGGGRLRLMGTH